MPGLFGDDDDDAPPPPDPYKVAQAQTGSNVMTGIANTVMGNADVNSPMGTMSFNQTGSKTVTDPVSGATYDVPTYEQNIKLSPEQQKLYDQQTGIGAQMNQTAGTLLNNVQQTLSQAPSTAGLPAQVGSVGTGPQFAQVGQGPQFNQVSTGPQMEFVGQAPNMQTGFADVGGPQRSLGPQDWSADRAKVEEALFQRINPQLQRDQAALESNLINQGFQRGTEAFNEAMNQSTRQANDARYGAIREGGNEQTRLFNLALQQGQFGNAAQNQDFVQQMQRAGFSNDAIQRMFTNQVAGINANNAAQQQMFQNQVTGTGFNNAAGQQTFQNQLAGTGFNNAAAQQGFQNQVTGANFQNQARGAGMEEMLALRNQPLNEMTALMSGGQVSMPQFANFKGGSVAATPIGDYIYKSADVDRKNALLEQEQNAATMGGIFNLGAKAIPALFAMSDRRLKRDVEKLRDLTDGLGWYRFRYHWSDDMQEGVMADEVEQVMPEAVVDLLGYKTVDYGLLREAGYGV